MSEEIIEDLVDSALINSNNKQSFATILRPFDDIHLTAASSSGMNENLQLVTIGLVSNSSSDLVNDCLEQQHRRDGNEAVSRTFECRVEIVGSSGATTSNEDNKEKTSSGISSAESSSDSSDEFKHHHHHHILSRQQLQSQQPSTSRHENDELKLLKYELKEKDLDIVQLQKEINELQLENKMLKVRMPLTTDADPCLMGLREDELKSMDLKSPYFKEILILKREKECAMEELAKAQDNIAKLSLEKSAKSIDIYDPNSPEVLNKKIRALEKQVQELEDENEKQINEYSKLEKQVEKLKVDNCELKQKVNESILHKEKEESLRLENNSLKNQLGRLNLANNQLALENQQFVNSLNSKSSINEGKVASTQTSVLVDNDDTNDATSMRMRFNHNDFLTSTTKQYSKPYDLYSCSYSNGSCNGGGGGGGGVDFKYKHNSDEFNTAANANANNNDALKYTLSRTDEHLISNFRPFRHHHCHQQQPVETKTTTTTKSTPIDDYYRGRLTIDDYDGESNYRKPSSYYSRSNGNLAVLDRDLSAHKSHHYDYNHHQSHHKPSIYSSSGETSSLDDCDDIKHLNYVGGDAAGSTTASSPSHKSMKINVMRDLKSAQKLRNALRNSTCYGGAGGCAGDEASSSSSSSSFYQPSASLRRSQTYMNNRAPSFSSSSSTGTVTPTATMANSNEDLDLEFFDKFNPIISEFEAKIKADCKKKPFIPQNATDVCLGDVVKFSRPGGKISKGVVKYIGPLPDRNEIYFGLELDSEEGKHDGVFLNKRYFHAMKNKGVFVGFSKVIMAWG